YNTSFEIAYKGNTDTLSQDLKRILEGIHTDLSMTYEAGTISRYSYSSNGFVNDVTINFTMDYHTTAEQEAFVNREVKRISGELFTSAMSDFDKVKAVNDYIVLNTTYSTQTTASPHAAYAILKEGKGVCQAYALLAYRLLKEAGIDAYYVTGYVEDVGHAWNLVKVNGEWYHLDTTWNDPVFNPSAGDMSDYVHYKYFLVPDSIIKLDHEIDDNNYPVATDNSFAPLHTVETPVQVGSTLYFPSRDHNIELYKLDLNNIAAGATLVSETRVQHLVHIDGWLYFSNYSNGGYLSKMKLDGTEQSVIEYKSITSLKRDGNNLVYTDTNNVTHTLQIIDPEAEKQAAADAVIALINTIDENAGNFVESVANARVAYEALTSAQKQLVTNYAVLEEAEGKIQANEATVSSVITKIAQLNEFASDFNEKVNEARTAYNALDAALRAKVSNYSVLEAAIAKVADNETKATDIEALINAINTNDATYYGATTTARNAFNALTAAQRTLVSAAAISKLEAAEQQKTKDEEAVFSVNYQLDLLNDTAANFKDIVPTIRAGYNALTANQKTLVVKLADLEAAEAKYQEYQTAASQLTTEIEALNSASPTFQQDVQTVNGKYNALNLAQQGFISTEAKAKLNELVALSITNANSADVVIAQIQALAITNESFMADVQATRAAYNALTPTQQGLVTNLASLESAEAIATKITNVVDKIIAIPETTVVGLVDNFNSAKTAYDALSSAEQKHVTNSDKLESTNTLITAANTVTATIASLTVASSITDIEAARVAYEALTPLQKSLVTNVTDLQNAEARVKTEADQLKAQAVVNQITALGTIDANFVAKYTAAKVAYDALIEDQKALVTNATVLTDLAGEILAIQEVIDAIDAVSDVTTYKANATVASSKYKDLDSTLQVAVTNAASLTAIEENIRAATTVETAISALTTASSMTDIDGVKAQYEALTTLQKQLISNYASIESIENTVAVLGVEQLITGLSESSSSFIADVTKARVAYDALTAIQQNLVSNYATLTAAEQRVVEIAQSQAEVTNVIQLIAKVNDTTATFQTDLSIAETAFNALTNEQKAQVTNANDLTTHNATLVTYQTVATNIESQVTSIDTASLTFIDDVNAAQMSLSAFNEAQLSFVTSTTKSLLQTYVDEIAAMRAVEAQLLALNALNTTFHADVAVAQAAYNALQPNYKVLLTAQALAKLGEAEQQVVTDRKAAQEVIEEIALLSASSSATSVSTVRAKYNALTANQKQLVTNSAHLISIETALTSAGSGTSSTGNTGSTDGTSLTGGTSSTGNTGSTGGTSSTDNTSSTSGTSSTGT
ncbi:MAG: transglutaminase domain-containing protein, partial [Lysinibacillus sp.]